MIHCTCTQVRAVFGEGAKRMCAHHILLLDAHVFPIQGRLRHLEVLLINYHGDLDAYLPAFLQQGASNCGRSYDGVADCDLLLEVGWDRIGVVKFDDVRTSIEAALAAVSGRRVSLVPHRETRTRF